MWVVFNRTGPERQFFTDKEEAVKELEALNRGYDDWKPAEMLTVDDYIHRVLGQITEDRMSYDIINRNYYKVKMHLWRLDSAKGEIQEIIDYVHKFFNELKKHRGD